MTVDDQIAKLQELLRRLLASQPPASGEPTENHETVATPSETKEVLPPAPSEPALPQPQALESRSRLLPNGSARLLRVRTMPFIVHGVAWSLAVEQCSIAGQMNDRHYERWQVRFLDGAI